MTLECARKPYCIYLIGKQIWDLDHAVRISISNYLRARDLKTLDVEWISDSMVAAGAPALWWPSSACVRLTLRSDE